MNFQEALKELQNGNSVKIKSALGRRWIIYNPEDLLSIHSNGKHNHHCIMFVPDCMKELNDWELNAVQSES